MGAPHCPQIDPLRSSVAREGAGDETIRSTVGLFVPLSRRSGFPIRDAP